MVVSNSGINAVPVEVALEGATRLTVVALTSLAHSAAPSRHAGGKPVRDRGYHPG
jgi:uncharacterized phosphosugar-binding protein